MQSLPLIISVILFFGAKVIIFRHTNKQMAKMFKINAYNVLLEPHKGPTPTLPVREGEPTAKEGE